TYYCPSDPGSNQPSTPVAQGTTCSSNFTSTESFSIDTTVTPPACTVIDNANSPWFDKVSGCTIPSSTDAPADFAVAWDCTAPDSFTEIDGSSLDFTSCKQFGDDGNNEQNSCDQQRNQKQ